MSLPELSRAAEETSERALVAVVQEAYVHGVSTRKVDDLMDWQDLRDRFRACLSLFAFSRVKLSGNDLDTWRKRGHDQTRV